MTEANHGHGIDDVPKKARKMMKEFFKCSFEDLRPVAEC